MDSYADTKFITGMRGWAAMAVFLTHQGGAGLGALGHVPERLVQHGRFGVIVFFVVSAFTLAMSIDRDRHYSYGSYLLRRFLRIAPLYYAVCLFCFFGKERYWAGFFSVEHDVANLIGHITFLNLFDVRTINGLIGPEWTVAIEMFFYLLLPLAVLLSKSYKRLCALGLLAVLFMYTKGPWIHFTADIPDHRALAYLWSPQLYVLAFVIGIVTYRLRQDGGWNNLFVLPLGALGIVTLVALNVEMPYLAWIVLYSAVTASVIMTSGRENRLAVLLFENPVIQYLGVISYSIYLVQYPVIYWLQPHFSHPALFFPVILGAVLGVASCTYYCIERPFLRLAKRVKEQGAANYSPSSDS